MTGAEDLVLTRVVRAPRERVFEAWTDAAHFARWFGPRAATVTDCELDPRPGGVLHLSAGLGTTFIPFRFLARPEATELII